MCSFSSPGLDLVRVRLASMRGISLSYDVSLRVRSSIRVRSVLPLESGRLTVSREYVAGDNAIAVTQRFAHSASASPATPRFGRR